MAGGVDHVQLVALTILGGVVKRHALRLDGDSALALKFHGVKHLRLHLAIRKAAAQLDEAVGEGRFAVVDVRDDGEITYVPHETLGES